MDQKKRNPLFLPVYVPTLILSFGRGMLIPVLPLYAKSFDTSYGLIGLMLAAEGLGTLIGDVPAGLLIRRTGKKMAMVLGVCCIALSVLALFWARSTFEVIFYRLIAGLGDALWNISRHAYIADVTEPHQRGRSLALFGGSHRIGSFVGPAVGGVIAAAYGIRTPFPIYAGLSTIAILTSAFSLETSAEEESASHSRAESLREILAKTIRSNRRVLATAGLGQLLAQMVRMGTPILIPLYAADVLGLDVQSVGWIMSLSSFIDLSMFYPAGVIMDRYGRKYAIVPCFLFQAVGMALVPFTSSFIGLTLATSLIGLANGVGSGTMMTLGADLSPKGARGEFLGVWRLVGDVGHTSSPILAGHIADLFSLAASTFVTAGFGLLAALTFAFLVPETLKKPPDSP